VGVAAISLSRVRPTRGLVLVRATVRALLSEADHADGLPWSAGDGFEVVVVGVAFARGDPR
jgi:hypothetical protein